MPPTNKKVLFAYSSPTIHHGSPRVLVDIIRELSPDKYSPILLCPRTGELTDFVSTHGVQVETIRWRSLTKTNLLVFLRDLFVFWRFFKKNKVELLHLNEIGWRDSLVLAAWLNRIPIILHLHVNYGGPIKGNFNFRLASKVFVVANVLKGVFEKFPLVHKKLKTVHNGLQLEPFANGQSIRTALGLAPADKVIGFVGQMVQAKGLRYLVLAAKEVVEACPDAIFLFVGRKVAGEEGFVDELKRLAEELNVNRAVRFFDARNDIPDVIKSLDILVLPTLGEAFPKVILEGMGAGIPVVASAVGGIPEIIEDGINGVLVPPGDSPALALALIALLKDGDKREMLASKGLSTVEHFTVSRQVEKIEAVYSELLK